jgi:hypothetical protein
MPQLIGQWRTGASIGFSEASSRWVVPGSATRDAFALPPWPVVAESSALIEAQQLFLAFWTQDPWSSM